MLEKILIPIFKKYLNDYFELADDSSLKLSLSGGKVHLKDVALKSALLSTMDLDSLVLDYGNIKNMKIEIPWLRIKSQSVRIMVSDVFVIVKPKRSAPWNKEAENKKKMERKKKTLKKHLAVQKRATKKKMKKVDPSKKEREEEEEKPKKPEKQEKPDDDSEYKTNFLYNLKEAIVHNLNVSVHNIHIRYEDVDRNYVLGVMLENFEMLRCNEKWEPHFKNLKTGDPFYYNGGNLRGLSAYASHGSIEKLEFISTKESKEEKFKSMSTFITLDEEMMNRSKILQLQGGNGEVRRKRLGEQRNPLFDKQPNWNVDVVLHDLTIRMSHIQKECFMDCADYQAYFLDFEKYRRFRPLSQLHSTLTHPQSWWKYLLQSSHKMVKDNRYTFSAITRRKRFRERYTYLFKKSRNLKWNTKTSSSSSHPKTINNEEENIKSRKNISTKKEFQEMEENMELSDIYYLREFAFAEIRVERKIYQKNLSEKGFLDGLFGRSTKRVVLSAEQKQEVHDKVRKTFLKDKRQQSSSTDGKRNKKMKKKKKKRKVDKKYNSLRSVVVLERSEIQLLDDEFSPIVRFVLEGFRTYYDEKGDKFFFDTTLSDIYTLETLNSCRYIQRRRQKPKTSKNPLVRFVGTYYENNIDKVYHPYDSDFSAMFSDEIDLLIQFEMMENIKSVMLASNSEYYHVIENPHPRNPNHYKRQRRQEYYKHEAVSNRNFKFVINVRIPRLVVPISPQLVILPSESNHQVLIMDLGSWKAQIEGPKSCQVLKNEYFYEDQKVDFEGVQLLLFRNYYQYTMQEYAKEVEAEETLYLLDLPEDEFLDEEQEEQEGEEQEVEGLDAKKLVDYVIEYSSVKTNAQRSLTGRGTKQPYYLWKNARASEFDLNLSHPKLKVILLLIKKMMDNSESLKRIKYENEYYKKDPQKLLSSSPKKSNVITFFKGENWVFDKINFLYEQDEILQLQNTNSEHCNISNLEFDISFSLGRKNKKEEEEETEGEGEEEEEEELNSSTKASVLYRSKHNQKMKNEVMNFEYTFSDFLKDLSAKDPEKCIGILRMLMGICGCIDEVFEDNMMEEERDGRWDLVGPSFIRSWLWKGMEEYFSNGMILESNEVLKFWKSNQK